MRSILLVTSLGLLLTACGSDPADKSAEPDKAQASKAVGEVESAIMGAHDPALGQPLDPALADDQPRPTMQAQVVLERLGFSSGVVDGKEGQPTRHAISGFQEANGLAVSGQFDTPTREALARWNNIPATRVVTVPANFAAGPFQKLPDDPAQQAKLPALGYQSLDEKLAERFHTTVETLVALNPTAAGTAPPASGAQAVPTAYFRAGQQIRVPNVGADRIVPGSVENKDWLKTLVALGVGTEQPKATKVVVSKSRGTLKAYDDAGKLIGVFTATMGSRHDPLPLGNWKIKGVAYNPPFHYNPELFWDVPDSHAKQLLPPGPNGPVGVAWIDLSKDHYGIHGTPEPQTIGRTESHGCVRLTNWDVARLAQMVSPRTRAAFEA